MDTRVENRISRWVWGKYSMQKSTYLYRVRFSGGYARTVHLHEYNYLFLRTDRSSISRVEVLHKVRLLIYLNYEYSIWVQTSTLLICISRLSMPDARQQTFLSQPIKYRRILTVAFHDQLQESSSSARFEEQTHHPFMSLQFPCSNLLLCRLPYFRL